MLYPEDKFLDNWNIFITFILLFTSIVTPLRIAFIESDDLYWIIINAIVDILFFIDIIIIFNTAFYDEDFKTIDDRKAISSDYASTWLFIDVISIIPFEYIMGQDTNSMNSMARFIRIGKMYRLIRLTRLLKMLKLIKERGKFIKYVNDVIKVGVGFERLSFFIFIFLIVCHVVSCLWVMTANLDEDTTGTWLEDLVKTD